MPFYWSIFQFLNPLAPLFAAVYDSILPTFTVSVLRLFLLKCQVTCKVSSFRMELAYMHVIIFFVLIGSPPQAPLILFWPVPAPPSSAPGTLCILFPLSLGPLSALAFLTRGSMGGFFVFLFLPSQMPAFFFFFFCHFLFWKLQFFSSILLIILNFLCISNVCVMGYVHTRQVYLHPWSWTMWAVLTWGSESNSGLVQEQDKHLTSEEASLPQALQQQDKSLTAVILMLS